MVGGLTNAGILLLSFLYRIGDLPRQLREPVTSPSRKTASIFEEPRIASMIQENIPWDVFLFEFLKLVHSVKQLVRIPFFYPLGCGLCLVGVHGETESRNGHQQA